METINDLMRIKNPEKAISEIAEFIKEEIVGKFQKSGSTIGLSGGIDSAVTAALCTRSLGAEKTLGVIMPEKESEPTSQTHAEMIAKKLNIRYEIIDITSILESFGVYRNKEEIVKKKFPDLNDACRYRIVVPSKMKNSVGMPFLEILDEENKSHKLKMSSAEFLALTAATSIKHRVRMTMLYYYGEKNNMCVMGTTNKSEYLQGYFVKYGDGGSDIEPLVNLYKHQVYQLGRFLDVPEEILMKNASPDVWSFPTTDEEFFYSVPYDVVDLIMYARENNLSVSEIHRISKISIDVIQDLLKTQEQKQAKSQHMREIPHGWKPKFA